MDSQNSNTAKFTFLYLLSLVSLAFFAVSVGIILFQLINKNITDIVESYNTRYSIEALRFALSAMIVSAPVYLVSVWQINKSLFSGVLSKDSAIRKWLTYFIVLVTSLIMIGETIGVINNFLNGELTLKFILKSATVLIIAGAIFYYYLRDIKREEVENKKDGLIKIYFYATVIISVIIFIAGIFFVESPMEARARRFDNEVVNRLSMIENAVQQYYTEENKLPESLEMVKEEVDYITEDDLRNPVTKKIFELKILDAKKYELCTEFQRSNINDSDPYESKDYFASNWEHDAGYQCIEKKVLDNNEKQLMPVRF